jgi:diguanylate cyclase (GGDEF)-like protein/PAS domain S-box-containing protein
MGQMQNCSNLIKNELEFLGYTKLSHIAETAELCISHAFTHEGQGVILKSPNVTNPPDRLLDQLTHELEIAADLDPKYVIHPLKIEHSGNSKILILESDNIQPLSRRMRRPLNVKNFLTIATGIINALAYVHSCGLIHKAIRPENILLFDSGEIKLSGFGHSSRLLREHLSSTIQELTQDDFSYIAPEQTGRMNRSVDSRSDLYSLGVVFYQMLTGKLPLHADNPMSWVHSHIAIKPLPPVQLIPTIPPLLSDMIIKLLAKDAEERYQTAEGLKFDLQRCQNDWLKQEKLTPFKLGQGDIPNHLIFPEKLYGRESELEVLNSAIERVSSSGKTELLLVSGYSGVGKSALIREFHVLLLSNNAFFAEGKFDQSRSEIPYATLAQALQSLVHQVLAKGEQEISAWRNKIIRALQPNARLITDLVPDLKLLIGDTEPVPDVPPKDAQNRFYQVIYKILDVFAQPGHPLVLFLDDLQWLDAGTLQLIEYLINNSDIENMLLLGAYRSNEVGPDHRLRKSIESIRQTEQNFTELGLQPLSVFQLNQLVSDSLCTHSDKTKPLAQLIQKKTNGNPFFASQFLSSLAETNLLRFNAIDSKWCWDLKQIEYLDYSDNVVDLVLHKLEKLDNEAKEYLKLLSCFGSACEIPLLIGITGETETKLQNVLSRALQAGLISRQAGHYRFLHDRIQEAAYSLIPTESRDKTHLDIGSKLLTLLNPNELSDKLFDVVNHLNLGAHLRSDEQFSLKLARLNYEAGLKAKASAAFITAADYYHKGISLLGQNPWSTDYDLALLLVSEAIESEYIKTNYENAHAMVEEAIPHARTSLDRAKLGRLNILIYTQIPDYHRAVEIGLSELSTLGIELIDTQPINVDLTEIDKLPIMTDPNHLMAMHLMITLIGSAYIVDPITLRYLTYTMLDLTAKHGLSAPSIYAYGLYGALLIGEGDIERGYQFGKAGVELCKQLKAPEMQSMALNMFNSCIRHWKDPLPNALSEMAEGVEIGLAYGDIENVSYCANHYCNNLLFSGTNLESAKYSIDHNLNLVKKLRQWYAVGFLKITRQTVDNLSTSTNSPGTLNGYYVNETELLPDLIKNNNYTLLFWLYTAKTFLNVTFNNSSDAFKYAEKAKPHENSSLGLIAVGELAFYHSLAILGLYRNEKNTINESHKITLEKNKKRLLQWADNARENYLHKYELILAEEARVQGLFIKAHELYEKAITGAKANHFTHEAALSYELTARFYLDRNMHLSAGLYLSQAYKFYKQWGGFSKTNELILEFPDLLSTQIQTLENDSYFDHDLDSKTVMKATQAVSKEIDLERLIHVLMTKVLENAGADRGLLILPGNTGLKIEAEAKVIDNKITVTTDQSLMADTDCAMSVINSAIHTHQSIIIDDCSHPNTHTSDPYFVRANIKSVLCKPLERHDKQTGALYLENSQTTAAFSRKRLNLLDVLATQAVISLDNSRLYSDLKQSEEDFRTVLQKVQAAVIVHGPDTQIINSNTKAQELLGLSEDQLLGKKAIDPDWYFTRDDGSLLPLEEYPVNQVLTTMKPIQNQVVGIQQPNKLDLTWSLVNATPLFEDDGSIKQVIVSFTDISVRKIAEMQLAASEQLFRTLVENSPDHIARYDLNLRRVYINPALEKQFSIPHDDIIGRTSKDSSPLLDPNKYMDNLRKVIYTKHEISDEIAFRTPNNEINWASTRFAPEFDLDGNVQSVLAISNIITQQKLAEQERKQNMQFLLNLDRINCVLQEEGNIEEIMNKALNEVKHIFNCDRSFLLHPYDQLSPSYTIPIESTSTKFPGTQERDVDLLNEDSLSMLMGIALENDHPFQLGKQGNYPISDYLTHELNIRSILAMSIHPRVDNAWLFGIHQCSYDRIWNSQEIRLFEEISHRISDRLNDLLVTKNLRESEERFRLVYENSPISIWEEDFSAVKERLDLLNQSIDSDIENYLTNHPETVKELATLVKVVNINTATLELHGAETKNELFEGLHKTFIPESYVAFQNELIALSRGETNLLFDSAVQTLNGERREVTISFSVCPGYEDSLSKVFVSLFDITQRRKDEESLRLAASVFSTSQEGILISDTNNKIIDINPAFTHLTGYSRQEAIGRNPSFLSAGRQGPSFYKEMWEKLSTTGEWQGEIWNQRKSGEIFPEVLSIVAVKDAEGDLQHYVGAFSDISMIKQHEADLDRIAHYDMLTSVPNRRLLRDRLDQSIAHTIRHGKNLAVCYLDLDGFKPINDQFGHEAGDLMLVQTARRLESMSRAEDTVARLGGDEFVLLWNDIDSKSDCIHALDRVLETISQPINLNGESISVSASIGVTLYPDDKVDADSLLRHADHAMYTAKQLGKNRYQIFDAKLERQISARLELLNKIANGLDSDQFELYYQPKINCSTGEINGVEALLRWNDPLLGLVGPKEFLSLIENESLELRLGRWVIAQAVIQAKTWHAQGISIPISINVFPRHLKYHTFIEDLSSTIAKYWPEMPERRLIVEIVETAALEDLESIEEVLSSCKKIGIGFSLDDFGTGYSSLVYLRKLSIEELKIDQSFVRDMLEDKNDEAIVISVIGLGKAFGLRVVAEGVESPQQAEHLMKLGCNIAQGYGIGRPMPPNAFRKWLNNYLSRDSHSCQ